MFESLRSLSMVFGLPPRVLAFSTIDLRFTP